MKNLIDNAKFVILMLVANSIGILGIQFIARYLGRL